MKKSYLSLLSIILLVSCNGNNSASSSNSTSNNSSNTSIEENKIDYSVKLFDPSGTALGANIMVQWCSDTNCFPAYTNDEGIASIKLEPNTYDIHLFEYPETYAFQIGKYQATEQITNLEINLVNLSFPSSGDGTIDNHFVISEGVYNATVNVDDNNTPTMTYFSFKANSIGSYTIESWADNIDTFINYYGNENVNEVIASDNDSGYSTNFLYEFEVNEENLNSTFIFGISGSGFRRVKTFSFSIDKLSN